jgi:endonuclease/exonuclease/phosphatase family metal-dependent hydrolase
MPSLRIVSINTGKGDGAYQRRLELLSEGLRALDPDVVLIQEALKSDDGALDTLRFLADRLDLHPSFAPARFKPREIEGIQYNTWSGIGILSKVAPDEIVPIELPMDPRDGDRVSLVAHFGNLAIASVHLTHLRDAEAALVRRRQIETVLDSDAFRDATDVLIGGDFNMTLDDIAQLLSGIEDWTAIDAFGSETENRANVPVTKPMVEGYCLDYIFALTRPGQSLPSFSDSRVVLGESDASGIYPSDHRGVMTTVTFSNDLEQAQ